MTMKQLVVILLIGIVGGLFISSSQTYEQQTIVPQLERLFPNEPFKEPLSKLEIPYWGITVSVEERGYYYFLEFLARKSAHFFTFGALAAVLYWLLPKWKIRFFLALLFTFFAASADEFHQSLTGGRTATWEDVVLDMSGAVIFLLIIQLVVSRRSRRTRR